VQVTADELDQLNCDSDLVDKLFREQIQAQAERWCDLVSERLDLRIRCIITPGNDDPVEADEVYAASERVEFPAFRVCDLGPFTMASLGTVPRR
jgi:Icc-related predicted phosphoesterase